jgi:FemAB-related protein (PEP-CTERM system-associated)
MNVSRFDGAPADWDNFVRAQTGWSHFHLYGWRTVMERAFGHECIYLAARDEAGGIVGVLPLVRVRSLIFGHFLVSMPFLNYGGPLGSEEAIVVLVAEAKELAAGGKVKLLELRARTELPIDLPVSHRKITVLLDLPETPEALMKQLPAKLRSQVRRPTKDGVTARIGPDQLGAFYEVFAHHMRDLGTPVLSRRFFEVAREVFGDQMIFAAAYHQDRPVACGCGFLWDGEFEISWASSLRSHNSMSPNMLIYWELMAHVIGRGAGVFNFGRCTRGSGTHKFKMQWGSREEQLWWYRFGRGAEEGDEGGGATPSQEKGVFALASRAWQRLPVPLTNRLGPAIVKFIP